VVRPALAIICGANVRHRERLPTRGPAILASNHNSHLDTLVLLDLCPAETLPHLRPVAAADYFLTKPWLAWIAIRLVGILPVRRKVFRHKPNPLNLLVRALRKEQILVFFPEGTRGEPEVMMEFKAGLARLAEAMPDCPVIPVYCHGLGKALPKGEWIPVPFFADIFVGEPLRFREFGSRKSFMVEFACRMDSLRSQLPNLEYR
jgi:1-acyl-sn-glycerol-3-phosphate acyltransferase